MKFVSLRKASMATMLAMTLATVAAPVVVEAASSASISVSTTTLPAAGQSALAQSVVASIQSTHAAVSAPPKTNRTTKSIVSDGYGYCALLTSGGVDCWGEGYDGALGNGHSNNSAIPVAVVSTSGSGTLGGVASLTSGSYGYCALLTSGGVDCWGAGSGGALGNGHKNNSNIPVAVVSTSGSGTLGGVASLTGDGAGYCALLTSGGVDCWGEGDYNELGNGHSNNSAIPVAVVSTSRSGTLSGVASLTSDLSGYCALLTSGGVDCWGLGGDGALGNGHNNNSNVPVAVVSTSRSGTLGGVASLTSDGGGFCALLTSGGVDCWGQGGNGELGNGHNNNSNIPVAVVSTSRSGTLGGVASLTSGGLNLTSGGFGFCALLTSGGVDCWGQGAYGELGNGHNNNSNIPVAVVSTSGSGTLGGVASLTSDGGGYCALLTSGGVDCWGQGGNGELGNGHNNYSTIPVAVVSTSGSGTLGGVASLTSAALSYCALLTSGGVDCWGYDPFGVLGNGQNNDSNVPVAVVSTSGSGTLGGVKAH
jgi:alpha-tubulin suppressor-like RCC1 family protein